MANQQPCKICEQSDVHSWSDWLMTAQQDTSGFPPGTTFYVCQPCLIGLVISQLQEAQGADVEVTVEDLPGPGVLEQIEHDEGEVQPAVSSNGRKGRKSGPEATPAVEDTETSAAADVHG